MSDTTRHSTHKLISGEFSTEDARTILMTLITNKIQFHQLDKWSSAERLGNENPVVTRRIEELQHTKEALTKLIDEAARNGERLAINCSIDIAVANELGAPQHSAQRLTLEY